MKALGRLLLATALIVPAGFMTVQSAGATPANSATCTSNTGTLHFTPGVRAANQAGQSITNKNSDGSVGRISGCTGIGISGSTGGAFSFTVARGAVTCNSIRGTTFKGAAKLVWDRPGSNAGVTTQLNINLTFDTFTRAHFSGRVTTTYLHGTALSGKITFPDKLKPVGVGGGQCSNSHRIKSLDYKNDGDTKL